MKLNSVCSTEIYLKLHEFQTMYSQDMNEVHMTDPFSAFLFMVFHIQSNNIQKKAFAEKHRLTTYEITTKIKYKLLMQMHWR